MTRQTLSIVVPVFNEEGRLPALLDKLRTDAGAVVSKAGLELAEVLLVDDGSTDGTVTLLDAFAVSEPHVRTLRFERNRGKGAAVRDGMLAATSQLTLMTDVDLSTPLEDIALLARAIEGGADIAIASRGLKESKVLVHQPAHRELMGKAFNLGVRMLTRVPWRDTQCGFKLFRRERTRHVFELQRVEGFAFDVEVLVTARRLGLHVSEVPVHWIDHPDTRVGVVTSSTAMALDVLRIAYRAHRPLPRVGASG